MIQSNITGNPDGSVTLTGPLTITAGCTSVAGNLTINSTSITTVNMYSYSSPEEMNRWFTEDGVEIVYKQVRTPLFTLTYSWTSSPQPEIIVYKEVHTFGPGGHKVERIEGKYIPPQDESYEFEY